MIKIIETNIVFKDIEHPYDVQSRIIEVDSWENYVDEIKGQKQVDRHSLIGDMYGVSFPRYATMRYFNANDRMLICTFYSFDYTLQMKTAYILQ